MSSDSYKRFIEKIIDHDAISASNVIEDIEIIEAADLLERLSPDSAVRILRNLQISFAASIIESTSDEFVSNAFSRLEPQLLTSFLMHVSKESRERMRPYISEAVEKQIQELLEYPEGSVGRVVSTDFLSFDKRVSAKDAIRKIRSLSKKNACVLCICSR